MSDPLQNWQPRGIDTTTPSTARMYDYYLGGKDNYPVDREAAEQVIAQHPQQRQLARNNRAFLVRAVRHLAEDGVIQFIDIGTGIPPRRASTRSPERCTRGPTSSTSTTTRSCWPTTAPCSTPTTG